MSAENQTAARFDHPEALAGEVWMGNLWAVDFQQVGWKSKRLGKVTYDSDGVRFTSGNMRPCFIAQSEAEAAGVAIPATGPIDHRW